MRKFVVSILIVLSLYAIRATNGYGYTMMFDNTSVKMMTNIFQIKKDGRIKDTVLSLKKYVFDNSQDGRFIGRLTDSLMKLDHFPTFNLKPYREDTSYILLIHNEINDENIRDLRGCIISEATGEPLFLMKLNDEDLSIFGIAPTEEVVTFLQKDQIGKGIRIGFIDDRLWMHALVRKTGDGLGLRIGFCGDGNVFEDSVMSKHFNWVKE